MLSKKEKFLMNYIYNRCLGKKTTLLYYSSFKKTLHQKDTFTEEKFEMILNNLHYEGYIFLEKSEDKKGLVFVVGLNEKGKYFRRELLNQKKKLISSIVKTILLAVLSFVVGIVLKTLFS